MCQLRSSISRPSADLWLGQTDEGELGFTYEEADQLLYLLVDQRYSPQDCVEAGFAEDFVSAGCGTDATQSFQTHPAADRQAFQPHDWL